MKRFNVWLPISILLGVVLMGGLVLMGYIFITGRGYYDSASDYERPETVSTNSIEIEARNTDSFIQIELDAFSVPSTGSTSDKGNKSLSFDDQEDDNEDHEGTEDDDTDEDYIIPESNRRKLTEEDLEDLTPKELSYARNEIYARYGRRFKSNELQEYFNSKEWYEIDDNFDDHDLQGIERSNAEFISEYQKKNNKIYKVN